MRSCRDKTGPSFEQAAIAHQERELSHDDFRRAHYYFWGAHDNCRRSYYDFVMMFVSRVPAPPAFRNKTSGISKEGDHAG